jgi:hypothetical protein
MKTFFIVWFVVSIVANIFAYIHITKKTKEDIKKL